MHAFVHSWESPCMNDRVDLPRAKAQVSQRKKITWGRHCYFCCLSLWFLKLACWSCVVALSCYWKLTNTHLHCLAFGSIHLPVLDRIWTLFHTQQTLLCTHQTLQQPSLLTRTSRMYCPDLPPNTYVWCWGNNLQNCPYQLPQACHQFMTNSCEPLHSIPPPPFPYRSPRRGVAQW